MAWYESPEIIGGGSSFREWQLGGRKAIVDKGGTVVVRFLPHPDVAKLFDEKGKYIGDGKYEDLAPAPFVPVGIHWYTSRNGLQKKVLCAARFDKECQLCAVGSKARQNYAANAVVVDKNGNFLLDENGKIDVRLLLVSRRVFDDILNMIRGLFGVGDITHPFSGRLVSFRRPANDRDPWRLQPGPSQEPILPGDPKEVLEFVSSLEPVATQLRNAVEAQGDMNDIDVQTTIANETRPLGAPLITPSSPSFHKQAQYVQQSQQSKNDDFDSLFG